ncbi:MAG: helix-turn-helix transcriptional regulator [Proteobacteria bacterium]|nr:helix-turn-helix transcriptional regulator [Pseudomonadota bacterium]
MEIKSFATATASSHAYQQPAATGEAFVYDPRLAPPNLTVREKKVLSLVCEGLSNTEIASLLGISAETVKSELKRIFRKIGVSNRVQAAVLLVKQGWI